MSAEDGSSTLHFGDGEYRFRIAWGQWRELQESVNRPRLEIGMPPVGPTDLLQLMLRGNAWPHDVREVIRLGLIGGGMKSDRALVLIKRHVESKPPVANIPLAGTILMRAMYGPPDDEVGKDTPPAETPDEPAADPSGFQPFTASVLQ